MNRKPSVLVLIVFLLMCSSLFIYKVGVRFLTEWQLEKDKIRIKNTPIASDKEKNEILSSIDVLERYSSTHRSGTSRTLEVVVRDDLDIVPLSARVGDEIHFRFLKYKKTWNCLQNISRASKVNSGQYEVYRGSARFKAWPSDNTRADLLVRYRDKEVLVDNVYVDESCGTIE